MFSTTTNRIIPSSSGTKGSSIRRLTLAAVAILLCSASTSFAAIFPGYQFLNVTGNFPLKGNAAFSQFSGANGVIKVTHSFPNGGDGTDDNNNAAIYPSQFTTLFPGTGQVQGHLVQTVYAHTSTVTFDMTGYSITPNTVFGMWNTTDEVTAPVGGNPVYRVQLLDASNTIQNPSTFSYMGNQDNQTQVQGRHSLVMTTSNGDVTFGGTINGGIGTHTDAAFWRNIPTTTKEIIVYADLPPLNTIGDGVGYYFAELVPEPSTIALTALGLSSLGGRLTRRRRR